MIVTFDGRDVPVCQLDPHRLGLISTTHSGVPIGNSALKRSAPEYLLNGSVGYSRVKTYSLTEVAADHGLDEVSVDPVRWLSIRLNRGELRGVRFGRYWRMRDSDIEYMLDCYSNDGRAAKMHKPASEPASIADGISARAQRRIRRS